MLRSSPLWKNKINALHLTSSLNHGHFVTRDNRLDRLGACDAWCSTRNVSTVNSEGQIFRFCQDVGTGSHEGKVVTIKSPVVRVSRSPAYTCKSSFITFIMKLFMLPIIKFFILILPDQYPMKLRNILWKNSLSLTRAWQIPVLSPLMILTDPELKEDKNRDHIIIQFLNDCKKYSIPIHF